MMARASSSVHCILKSLHRADELLAVARWKQGCRGNYFNSDGYMLANTTTPDG